MLKYDASISSYTIVLSFDFLVIFSSHYFYIDVFFFFFHFADLLSFNLSIFHSCNHIILFTFSRLLIFPSSYYLIILYFLSFNLRGELLSSHHPYIHIFLSYCLFTFLWFYLLIILYVFHSSHVLFLIYFFLIFFSSFTYTFFTSNSHIILCSYPPMFLPF